MSLCLNVKENLIGPVLVKCAFLVQPAMTKAKLVLFTCQNTQTTQIPDLVDIFKIVCFSWKHNYSRLTAEKSWAIVLVRKVFGGNNTNMLQWLKQRKINCSDRPRSLTIGFTIVLLVQQLLSAKADITMILLAFHSWSCVVVVPFIIYKLEA